MHTNITNPGGLNVRAISLTAAVVHPGALTCGNRLWLTLRVLKTVLQQQTFSKFLTSQNHRRTLLAFPLHIQKSKFADLNDVQKKLVRFLLGKRGVLLC